MASKTVQITVDVKNVEITAGVLSVFAAQQPTDYSSRSTVTGNTFSVDVESDLEYFAVSFVIRSYTFNGNPCYCDRPITLMSTFTMSEANTAVMVSPESTIATMYTFARMIMADSLGFVSVAGPARSLKIAYGMKLNLFLTQGGVAEMIQTAPNGFQTNSYPMFNSLCNLFYYCLTDNDFYTDFLGYVWHPEKVGNDTFVQALRHMLHDPFTGAADIYNLLAARPEVYTNSLTTMNVPDDRKAPNNWTLTLKSNSSGSKNFIPAGAAFVVFDADDNAWVANNFRAGSGDSGTHCPVYKYNATPADFSPVQGGGLLGVAFGAAIDPDKEYISFGNFGWGSEYNNPQEGGISRFYKDGTPVSPSNGFTPGLTRVQGMEYDRHGNLWMASVGCQEPFAPAPLGVYPFKNEPSAVTVYLKQDDPTQAPTADQVLTLDAFPIKKTFDSDPVTEPTPYLKVFDVTPTHLGHEAYVSCIGNYDSENPDNCVLSAVYKVEIKDGALKVTHSWYSDFYSKINKQKGFESLRQVAVNAVGEVVVVGVSSSRATVLYPDLTFKMYYDTNTYNPWGVKIDRMQSVYLANFGREDGETADGDTLDLKAPFGVTLLRNPTDPTSAKLLTLPTGGDEVTLANGWPLYGTQLRPAEPLLMIQGEPTFSHRRMKSYQPLMRLTSTNIDGAGNLWCMNNWKPSALVDVKSNPGGDGVVIFLGIAEPE